MLVVIFISVLFVQNKFILIILICIMSLFWYRQNASQWRLLVEQRKEKEILQIKRMRLCKELAQCLNLVTTQNLAPVLATLLSLGQSTPVT